MNQSYFQSSARLDQLLHYKTNEVVGVVSQRIRNSLRTGVLVKAGALPLVPI